jgi:hypothetical protein
MRLQLLHVLYLLLQLVFHRPLLLRKCTWVMRLIHHRRLYNVALGGIRTRSAKQCARLHVEGVKRSLGNVWHGLTEVLGLRSSRAHLWLRSNRGAQLWVRSRRCFGW